MTETAPYDIFVIGGGINGCGIARDASGRGLSVALAEQGDLAQATSSSSTKLFHGGLRYLEFFEFRLVREALIERETLLRAMPHIAWPMRFVLPFHEAMRFDSTTPVSRLLAMVMPWAKGRRPAWLIRLGLFLYDHMGGRKILPPTRAVDLAHDPVGGPLQARFTRAYAYSDVWVEDSRLVVLNARDAQKRGARIMTGCKVVSAERGADLWQIRLEHANGTSETLRARSLVNAGGPWVGRIIGEQLGIASRESVRLVRGSHIVTRRLFDHDKCYFFQGKDGRIIFAIPYERDFTLIGTTDQEHEGDPSQAQCTPEEQEYLCAFASEYFEKPVTRDDIVWTYSGVRPLYDDGAKSATAATRDYVLSLDTGGPVLLNVFGGKITTYRKLAEAAMRRLAPYYPEAGPPWTAGIALPGGDFPVDGVAALTQKLRAQYPFLAPEWALRLVRAYGTDAFELLGEAKTAADLGRDYGATLTDAEIDWLVTHEFASSAEDILWRRTKLGLRLDPDAVCEIRKTLAARKAASDEPRRQAPSP
jgi:glycerol-3-phosphate dehydrogenase